VAAGDEEIDEGLDEELDDVDAGGRRVTNSVPPIGVLVGLF